MTSEDIEDLRNNPKIIRNNVRSSGGDEWKGVSKDQQEFGSFLNSLALRQRRDHL